MPASGGATIRVAVSGARGRMGREVIGAVLAQSDMRLVGAFDVVGVGEEVERDALPPSPAAAGESRSDVRPCGVRIVADVAVALAEADVLVDFTRGDVAPNNILAAVERGIACVVGTTGISADALSRIDAAARGKGVPVLVAPNFALGAVLMMRFAREAARFYEWAEIVELHHENKVDAPSGTALRTAELMAAERSFRQVENETEKLPGVRGNAQRGVRIHSVRLPGLVAHQEVILGGSGETLTIRHDSMSRVSFMSGVLLAIRRVRGRSGFNGLITGLEHLMD